MATAYGQKRQKIDRELELRLADPQINAEAKILENVRSKLFASIHTRWQIDPSRPSPTLYSRYRVKGFPLRQSNGRKLPRWRDLSPWMKLQVATLVLAEGNYIQFTLQLHDDRVDELVADGDNIRKYMIDRITRRLRGTFGSEPPGFLFVAEDRDKSGAPVRPHAHGSIAIPMVDVALAPSYRRGLSNLVAKGKVREAQILTGRMIVRLELKAAAGLNRRAPKVAASGRNQSRNVWTKRPTFTVLTHHWINYAFKNVPRFGQVLGEDRVAISTALRAQARDLWDVIRNGDKAIEKIEARIQGHQTKP